MTTYNGACHCGQTEWTVKLDEVNHILWYQPIQLFVLQQNVQIKLTNLTARSHCGACKVRLCVHVSHHLPLRRTKLLSGGEYTLNTVTDKANVKVTKGDLKVYSYKGDSGTLPRVPVLPFPLHRTQISALHS